MSRSPTVRWRAAAHAALLAGAVLSTPPAFAAPPVETPSFAPPAGRPLTLSRTVVRELPGGAAIVATRRYRVTFRPLDEGWAVDGALVDSEIDAPPSLAALAAIERARPDDGMFPILLDRTGRIVAEPTAGLGRDAVRGAVAEASHGDGPAPGWGLLAQVGAVAATPGSGLTNWPEGLFLPHGLEGTSEHAVALPDGGMGSVRVSLESVPSPDMAMMGRAARTVVTEAAGTRRIAREEWTLGPPSRLTTP